MEHDFKVGDKVFLTKERIREFGSERYVLENFSLTSKTLLIITEVENIYIYTDMPGKNGYKRQPHYPEHLVKAYFKPIIIIKRKNP